MNLLDDIKICLKRLYQALDYLDNYFKTRDTRCFGCLDLDADPPHPILNYSQEEKQTFIQMFGEPLVFPDKFEKSPKQIKDEIETRIDLFRRMAGMKPDAQVLGPNNYLCYPPRKKSYFTGRLVY